MISALLRISQETALNKITYNCMGLSELQSTMNICILRKTVIGAASELEILLLKDECD